MEQRNTYHTKQKEQITQLITQKTQEFTIKDIFDELANSGENIGLTTVYRAVDKLWEEGYLSKSVGQSGTIYYRFLKQCENSGHCFLECKKCGQLTHADCRIISELGHHLIMMHHFVPDHKNIIIHGICEKCTEKGAA